MRLGHRRWWLNGKVQEDRIRQVEWQGKILSTWVGDRRTSLVPSLTRGPFKASLRFNFLLMEHHGRMGATGLPGLVIFED